MAKHSQILRLPRLHLKHPAHRMPNILQFLDICFRRWTRSVFWRKTLAFNAHTYHTQFHTTLGYCATLSPAAQAFNAHPHLTHIISKGIRVSYNHLSSKGLDFTHDFTRHSTGYRRALSPQVNCTVPRFTTLIFIRRSGSIQLSRARTWLTTHSFTRHSSIV